MSVSGGCFVSQKRFESRMEKRENANVASIGMLSSMPAGIGIKESEI